MSTDSIEVSDALGEPIELYRFSYGPGLGVVFGYTDADVEVTFESTPYRPAAAIERDSVTASQTLDKAEMTVSIDHDSEIAELFREYPPSDVVGLTLFRCHWDDSLNGGSGGITTPVTVWAGRVLSAQREGYIAQLTCEPVVTSLRRVGLRRHYQYMCPHVLYGAECRADRLTHTASSSATAVDARSVTVSGIYGSQYRGGLVSWQPVGLPLERRTVLDVAADSSQGVSVLTLAGAPRALEVGDTIELSLGCSHTLADCRDVFDNGLNFGGMPYIPTKNPHGSTSIYN